MAGWQEAATTPDLMEWLNDLDQQDWQDMADDTVPTVERRKVAYRDSRTAHEHFKHLYDSGMPMQRAKAMTERWIANGGDSTKYTVRTAKAQQRPTERDDRPGFDGFYRGPPRMVKAESCGRTVQTPKTESRAEALGRQWYEMRRHG